MEWGYDVSTDCDIMPPPQTQVGISWEILRMALRLCHQVIPQISHDIPPLVGWVIHSKGIHFPVFCSNVSFRSILKNIFTPSSGASATNFVSWISSSMPISLVMGQNMTSSQTWFLSFWRMSTFCF